MAAATMRSVVGKKRKMVNIGVDEFMEEGFDSDIDDTSETASGVRKKSKGDGAQKKTAEKAKSEQSAKTGHSENRSSATKHKISLDKLKERDPEFYKFLQTEDKALLGFSASDDEDEEEEDSDSAMESEASEGGEVSEEISDSNESNSDAEVDGRYHKPPDRLEVASDASDVEDDEEDEKNPNPRDEHSLVTSIKVTSKMISQWGKIIKENPSPAVYGEVTNAFKAAVLQASGDGSTGTYRVRDSSIFNGIVRLCVTNIAPALHTILQLPFTTDIHNPVVPSEKSKKWKKVRLPTKAYLTNLLHLFSKMSDPAMVNIVVKHIHRLAAFYSCFPDLSKKLLKKMITLWSTSEESARVASFLVINRLVRMMQRTRLELCLKDMYMAYVKNCKFTSPSTLPLVNFMQHSLVEILSIDFSLAYQYMFVYVRQMAVHLRNAITVKKKETTQAVYNWQFIHCLELWVKFLAATYPNDVLQPLIYPLTQTIIGTIKLVPTARYYPLRFHCIRALNELSSATHTFIPVLPFLLEIFEQTDFNKKHRSISLKPFTFACILKLSKSQILEKSFRDGIIDQMYELLMEQFNIHAHSVGFPELALPAILQLKAFLKTCKVANYCKQIKQILDKVDETVKFITNRRNASSLSLSDTNAIDAWERQCKDSGTPIGKYYATWRKLRDRELQSEIAGKERIVDNDKIPVIQKPKGVKKATPEERKAFAELFESDSEESDDERRFLLKSERPAKTVKKSSAVDGSDDSDYSDFDSDEMEQLAQSGDDDDEVESDVEGDNGGGESDGGKSDDGEEHDDIVKDFRMSDSESDD